jgi:hypothetical protein
VAWKDNSTNELGFAIERHEGACGVGTFTEVSRTAANVITWRDAATVVGKAYCYRVRAFNNSMLDGSGVVQYSGYTNEAGVAYPLANPAAPSEATAQ